MDEDEVCYNTAAVPTTEEQRSQRSLGASKSCLSGALPKDKVSVQDARPHLAAMHPRLAVKKPAQRFLQNSGVGHIGEN